MRWMRRFARWLFAAWAMSVAALMLLLLVALLVRGVRGTEFVFAHLGACSTMLFLASLPACRRWMRDDAGNAPR